MDSCSIALRAVGCRLEYSVGGAAHPRSSCQLDVQVMHSRVLVLLGGDSAWCVSACVGVLANNTSGLYIEHSCASWVSLLSQVHCCGLL
jgi:hypothetical protein